MCSSKSSCIKWKMAGAASLPIIIHCRPSNNSENAWDDVLRLIRENWASSGLGGVLVLLHRTGRACPRGA